VSVRLWDTDAERPEERRTRTDSNGSFVVGSLADGTYALELTAAGFMPRLYRVRVAGGDTTAPLPLSLDQDPKWFPEPAVVTHSKVPVYPIEARRRGIEGEVRIRVGENGSQISHVSGDPLLAPAALAIVKSWQFKRPSDDAFEVLFEYRLTPGDCSGDDRPTVRLQFPQRVSVTAKRVIRCG
jgi:TonB family protein